MKNKLKALFFHGQIINKLEAKSYVYIWGLGAVCQNTTVSKMFYAQLVFFLVHEGYSATLRVAEAVPG